MSKRRNRPQRDHKQPILQPITRRKLVIVHAHELTLEDIDTESLHHITPEALAQFDEWNRRNQHLAAQAVELGEMVAALKIERDRLAARVAELETENGRQKLDFERARELRNRKRGELRREDFEG